FVRAVAPQPAVEDTQVVRVLARGEHRHLVGAPGALDRDAVDLLRPGPAFRRPQYDHRPAGPFARAVIAGGALGAFDLVERLVESGRELLVDLGRVVAGDEQRVPAVAFEERDPFLLGDPGEYGRVGDLVAVQMQEREDGAVPARVEELVAVPARRERPRLSLAVSDHAGDDE